MSKPSILLMKKARKLVLKARDRSYPRNDAIHDALTRAAEAIDDAADEMVRCGLGIPEPPPVPPTDLPGVLLGDAVTLALYAPEGETFGRAIEAGEGGEDA